MLYLTAKDLNDRYVHYQRSSTTGASTVALWEAKAGDKDSDGSVRDWSGSALISGSKVLVLYASLGTTQQRVLLGQYYDLGTVRELVGSLISTTGGVDLETLYRRLQDRTS